MESGNLNELLKGAIIENNKDEVERILNEHHAQIDLMTTTNGTEGSIINIAIERADVNILALLLLGVRYPLAPHYATAISHEQHTQINSECDVEGMTPLMKSVKLQKRDMVTLLLNFGADVNYFIKHGPAAIDLSNDPEILCLLFEHDSKFPVDQEVSKEVEDLISEDNGKLKELFMARDKVHKSFKGRKSSNLDSIDSDIKKAIMRGKYYVNRKGHSLMYTTLKNKKFNAWALLLDLGMDYATMEEKEWENHYEKECEHALRDVLVPLDDCHIMKLFTRSLILQSNKHLKWSDIVLDYFKHMNVNKITQTLMEVVQDIPGLEIAFDFEYVNTETIRHHHLKNVYGIADRFKICIAPKKNNEFDFPEIIGNIAHELCHLALAVVYKNNGLPYFTNDIDCKQLYEEVMDKVRCSSGCDKIISDVWKYPKVLQERELIVRVPEIISKYQGSVHDGLSRLKEHAEVLLKFYEKHVQPDLENYVQKSFTSGKIKGRRLIEYQELYLQSDGIRVADSIERDITDFVVEHNGLKVLKTSSLKVALSHLTLSLERKGKPAPLKVDWSFYHKNGKFFTNLFTSGEIDTLAIAWDGKTQPSFCKLDHCRGNCIGSYISDFKACIYLLISPQFTVPMEIISVEYFWNDLSDKTKEIIQERKIEFNGKNVELKTLFPGLEEGYHADKFFRDFLDSKDINLILEGGDIAIGKSNLICDARGDNMVLKYPESFIPRVLTQKYVNFDDHLLKKFKNDVFCVSNIEISRLRELVISEGHIKQWNSNIKGIPARCYVLNPSSDVKKEESVIKEILEHHRGCGQGDKLHYLKVRQGMYAHIRSVDIQNGKDNIMNKVEGLVSSCTVKNLLQTSAFQTSDPLLIADDPGTGKTTYLHTIAKEIKKTCSDKWVSIIDLGLPAQQKHILTVKHTLSYSREEALDLLSRLVVSGQKDSLERKIFNEFCERKNKIIIIFDGFDEICPHYKSVVISFIRNLRKFKDDIKLLVSSQLSERFDLEEELGVISLQLKPFSEDDQLKFLNSYWNELLKGLSLSDWQEKIHSSLVNLERWVEERNYDDIRKVISKMKEMSSCLGEGQKLVRERINLTPVARRILDWQMLFNGMNTFTETPLHVKMMAALIFYDSFNLKQTMVLGHLYERFFNMKMEIFFQKCGPTDNIQSRASMKMVQERITDTLEKLSVNLLLDEHTYKIKIQHFRFLVDIGLVSDKVDELQFTHRTFAEFFFAKWMLREAGKSEVTKFWLESLFVDDRYVRVRKFLEDILQPASEGLCDSTGTESPKDYLTFEKATLEKSVIESDSGLHAMTTTIYALVFHGSVYSLQFLADSIGKTVAEKLLCKFQYDANSAPHCPSLQNALYLNYSYTSFFRGFHYPEHEGEFGNVFSFAAVNISKKENMHPDRSAEVVKKMFDLVKDYKMLNEINQLLLTWGFYWLFPYIVPADGRHTYSAKVMNCLLEHKEIFVEPLRCFVSSTAEKYDNLVNLFTSNFSTIQSLLSTLYDETEQKHILEEEGLISRVWAKTAKEYGREKTMQVWEMIKGILREDETALENYLRWKNEDGYNALFNAAYNVDPNVIEFIWEKADEVKMCDTEKRDWLLKSFNCGVEFFNKGFSEWSFHKFVVRLVNSGFLSGDDMFHLLTSKDKCGHCCILDIYPLGLFTHVPHINHFVLHDSYERTLSNKHTFSHISGLLKYNSSHPLSEDLKVVVDCLFEEVKSRDKYGLVDQLEVDECGFLVVDGDIHVERFKYFVAAFYKHVELCRGHFGVQGLIQWLKGLTETSRLGNSVLHSVVFEMLSLCLGYVCSVLTECLPRDHFLDLLFDEDEDGNTLFHECVKREDDVRWGKLCDVAMVLLGGVALSKIHTIKNNEGLTVKDIFYREDRVNKMKIAITGKPLVTWREYDTGTRAFMESSVLRESTRQLCEKMKWECENVKKIERDIIEEDDENLQFRGTGGYDKDKKVMIPLQFDEKEKVIIPESRRKCDEDTSDGMISIVPKDKHQMVRREMYLNDAVARWKNTERDVAIMVKKQYRKVEKMMEDYMRKREKMMEDVMKKMEKIIDENKRERENMVEFHEKYVARMIGKSGRMSRKREHNEGMTSKTISRVQEDKPNYNTN